MNQPNRTACATYPATWRLFPALWTSGGPFVVTELGADADPFMLHLYAVLAQKERALIASGPRRRCCEFCNPSGSIDEPPAKIGIAEVTADARKRH